MSLEPKAPVVHRFLRKPEILEVSGTNILMKSPVIIAGINKKLMLTKVASAKFCGNVIDKVASKVVQDSFHGQIARDSKGNVDLMAEFKKHPEALWIRVKAIEVEVPNDNGDCFSREEVKKSYLTFEGCPVFTNHENTKVENAKGKVVKAEWDEKEGAVYCTMFVDRDANPSLCRAIEEGYVTDVSMGTQVEYSTCSVCANKAYTADDYCKHVKGMKGRTLEGKKVYENNYGLKFIEISVVTDGACKDCTIREVIDPDEFMDKVASVVGAFKKTAGFTKDSGQAEIQKLNQAMDLLEDVSRSMLDQRQYVDLEFLSKVTDVLADLQHVNDELVDQGYGSIGAQQAQPSIPPPPSGDGLSLSEGQGEVSPSMSGSAGVGSVTEPVSASSSKKIVQVGARIKELQEKLKNIAAEAKTSLGGVTAVEKSDKHRETTMKLAKIWENPSVKQYKMEVSAGAYTIVVAGDEVVGLRSGKKIASLKKADLDADVRAELENNQAACAQALLEELKASVENGGIQKQASLPDEKQQQESTIEKQLSEQKLELHPRDGDERTETMEGQLSTKRDGYDEHTRQNKERVSTMEVQLSDSEKGYDYHKRQGTIGSAEQTIEKQLRDTSIHGNENPADRKTSVEGVTDQVEQPTGAQLDEWRKGDKGFNPTSEITEKQLNSQGEPWGRRIASTDDAKKALAAATKAIVQASIATGATPEEILSVISDFNKTPMNAVAAVKAVASLASGKEARMALYRRSKFHGASKTASIGNVANFLLGSLSDNGLGGEVGIKVLAGIAGRKSAVSEIGEAIIAGASSDELIDFGDDTTASTDYLKEVLAGGQDSEESPIIVHLKESQIKADKSDEAAFAKAAFAAATVSAQKNGVKVTENVQVKAKRDGNVEVTLKGIQGEAPIEAPKVEAAVAAKVNVAARKEARQKLAQMGGATPDGGMGMGAGAPGGGGTTMPTPPPADPAAGGPPPTSSLGTPAPGEEGAGDEEKGEALPPGSICPVCGSDSVDLRGGEFDCKDCGAHGHIEVDVKVDTWPSTIEDTTPKKDEDEGADEGGIGDMAGGAGMEMPPMGLAASFKITPEMVKKAGNKPLGSYCPNCASSKVKIASKDGCVKGKCEHCDCSYRVDCFVDTANKNELWARMAWADQKYAKFASAKRAKLMVAASNKAKATKLSSVLSKKGLTAKFAMADGAGKAKIIGKLLENGSL